MINSFGRSIIINDLQPGPSSVVLQELEEARREWEEENEARCSRGVVDEDDEDGGVFDEGSFGETLDQSMVEETLQDEERDRVAAMRNVNSFLYTESISALLLHIYRVAYFSTV